MRALAIDLGKVRVGLAASDELGMMAHPRPFLDGRNRRALLEALDRLAKGEDFTVFVVGLPRQLNGSEGLAARRARKFAEELGNKTGRPVELVDEWLSTREARARLHEQGLGEREVRGRVDSAAAAVLLQAWLDSRASSRARQGP
jgi:putative Holliday junction resolvase